MDIAHSEAAEVELNRLIERYYDRRVVKEERPALEMWQESEREYAERRRERNRQAWATFHETQGERHRRTLANLMAHHEERARKLLAAEDMGNERSA